MSKKFDNNEFLKDMVRIINKHSKGGNKFTNAEILASMTSIFIDVLNKTIPDKEAAKYVFERIIEDALARHS